MSIERGHGVGIEYTENVLRGVRLSPGEAATTAAAEVPLHDLHDDRSTLDAFVRLRAELGNPSVPTRLAIFPSGSSLRRIDVTGRTGPELNALRADFERRHGATSTVLLDNDVRRWMYVLQWNSARLRRLEDLAERSGFLEVAIDPSPLALARVCNDDATFANRSATTNETFVVALDGGVPVAAASTESVGRTHPNLAVGRVEFSVAMFDHVVDPAALAEQLTAVQEAQEAEQPSDEHSDGVALHLGNTPYPNFPPHDLRSPERQCVALGAAVGAAGLSGRLRPVDILSGDAASRQPRPWAIERVSSLPTQDTAQGPSETRKFLARLIPRRRKRAD